MKILKFRLKGRTAFFKQPDVNTYYYFTYGQIHKIALLGIFGAVLGYSGYSSVIFKKSKKEQNSVPKLPEFYTRLKDLHISVAPRQEKGGFARKIQTFNNSVGYASKEQGGNLIVKEQWLENPDWDIYVLLDCTEAHKIAQSLIEHKAVYIPYLGKNEHPAELLECKILEGEICKEPVQIHSLCCKECLVLNSDGGFHRIEFKYEEKLPLTFQEPVALYQLETMVFTNIAVHSYTGLCYEIQEKNIAFY